MKASRLALPAIVAVMVCGCALFTPLPPETNLDERLSAIPLDGAPLKGPVTIYWDSYQIPFIEARYDEDAAVALGIVHAHLRLGMMQLARRLAQGRLSEMVGPAGVDVDHAIRILDFDRAVPEILETMPEATRAWLDGFVAGLNYYQANVATLPHEYQVMAFEIEPWTAADVLTFGRLASSDATWTLWKTLLPLRDREDWPELYAQIAQTGLESTITFDGMQLDDVDEVVGGYRIAGSNAIAIGPTRSRTGATLFSADPHLGFIAPNVWLLAGVKSPSFHVVGLMPTGLPFFALGRNPDIAWGGTNMYAASSSFYDLSQADDPEIVEEEETIQVRFGSERTVTVRRSKWGPVISDIERISELVEPDIALRWVGHQPSDEISAMLGINRAASFADFRAALGTYAVSGINMLYADKDGNVGHVLAVRLPRRPETLSPDIIQDPDDIEPAWQSFVDATTLPVILNPDAGFVATANNRPLEADVPIGLLFSTNDRIERITQLMDGWGEVDLDNLEAMHRDVYMQGSVDVRDAFVAKTRELGLDQELRGPERSVLALMERWDGRYEIDSRGALAFELFYYAFRRALYEEEFGKIDLSGLVDVIGSDFKVLADLHSRDPATLEAALRSAFASAADRIGDFENWGDAHRLQLFHPFDVIPGVGDKYLFGNHPFGGSIQTLMKAGYQRSGTEYRALYGAGARFLSDLSDPDSNYFVLLGGQDGWFNSPSFLDQVPVWLAGDYIQLPLRSEAVQANAERVIVLRP